MAKAEATAVEERVLRRHGWRVGGVKPLRWCHHDQGSFLVTTAAALQLARAVARQRRAEMFAAAMIAHVGDPALKISVWGDAVHAADELEEALVRADERETSDAYA